MKSSRCMTTAEGAYRATSPKVRHWHRSYIRFLLSTSSCSVHGAVQGTIYARPAAHLCSSATTTTNNPAVCLQGLNAQLQIPGSASTSVFHLAWNSHLTVQAASTCIN